MMEDNVAIATRPRYIVKRDGRTVDFDPGRIEAAIRACFTSVGEDPKTSVGVLAGRVVALVSAASNGGTPTVEGVQDLVEVVLQANGEFNAAKHYILYRAEHAKQRADRPIPTGVKEAFESSAKYFPSQLQQFQFFDKYSRFDYDLGRRETWEETVDRTVAQFHELAGDRLGAEDYTEVRHGILTMRAMPSMRMLAMAGPAFRRDNATQYNCTYLPVDGIPAWVEGLLLSMAGCGVGFSVERQYVEQLPRVLRQDTSNPQLHIVEDSAIGWGKALESGLEHWFYGKDVRFDFSLVRPRGAVLRTKGGRASGPEPLQRLLEFTRRRILSRQGSFLRTIDAHDIMCAVGGAAVSGGVRRTAMISLFDADDASMATCKSGDFERENSQRWNANNSAVWVDTASMTQADFVRQFMTMVDSGRGEPGIFSRDAAERLMPARRGRGHQWGSNPCGEIVLRPHGMCNLTTVVARTDDTLESLSAKVHLATVMGTIQSLGTHFPYLRQQWRINAEEERLLGVSIGGQMDCPLLTGPDGAAVMKALRNVAVVTNAEVADKLGINRSAAVTCVKPDGNSSQLLDMSSGLHPRWARHYIRNVRVSSSSAVSRVLYDAGVPMNPENGDDPVNPRTWVVSFPVKAPDGAVTRNEVSAVQQCEFWLQNKVNWTEHNPSVTITYRPDEVIPLLDWVWKHREMVGGMAFLPASDAKYDQLPYIEVTREQYLELRDKFPGEVDFSKLYRYEGDDQTTAAQEVACVTGLCEV